MSYFLGDNLSRKIKLLNNIYFKLNFHGLTCFPWFKFQVFWFKSVVFALVIVMLEKSVFLVIPMIEIGTVSLYPFQPSLTFHKKTFDLQ